MAGNALVFPTSIDLAGLDRDISTAVGMLDAMTGTARSVTVSVAADKVDTGGFASSALGMAASFIPVGAMISGTITRAIGQVEGIVGKAAKTISKQLNDAFTFAQATDNLKGQKDLFDHSLNSMRDHFRRFSNSVEKDDVAKHAGFIKRIKEKEAEYRLFLMHSAANFKKGKFLPSIDDLFTNKSKTFKGGGDKGSNPGNGDKKSLLAQVNPVKAVGSAAGSALSMIPGPAAIATAAVVGIGAAFAGLAHGVVSASNLAESINKVDVQLGAAAPAVKAFADDMARRFGLVKGITLDTAASFGGLGRSLGRLGGDKLAGFSTQFTKLAADLSSFENIDLSTAAEALRTGLSGNQSDLLKKLGVVMTEDTVKAYAYAHGIAKVGTELNEQQKFMARQALIASGLSKVNGDLERTQGGAANQGRKLWGSLENLATSVGTALLPAFNEALVILNEFGTWVTATFEANKGVIEGWSTALIQAFDWVVAAAHNFPAAFEVARLKVIEGLVNITEYFAVLGPNIARIGEYIANNWTKLLYDAFNATIIGLQNLWANFQAIGTAIGEWLADPLGDHKVKWTGLLDGFQATADQMPALLSPVLTDMSKQIAEAGKPITDEVKQRRARREMAAAPAKAADAAPVDEALKEKKGKKGKATQALGGALELGSKEAYSAVVNATAGRSKGMDAIEKSGNATARNTAVANKLAAERNRLARRPARNMVIP